MHDVIKNAYVAKTETGEILYNSGEILSSGMKCDRVIVE